MVLATISYLNLINGVSFDSLDVTLNLTLNLTIVSGSDVSVSDGSPIFPNRVGSKYESQ